MTIKPHAFVAMPFGQKPGADGQLIDFNRVYSEYIAPALQAAGLSVFRADQEQRAGDIRTDMFQELLIADLVVADLTIDNPNVWYELGVRHALRARGVVLVFGSKAPGAFDLYTDRKLRYSLKDGAPDPASLEADKKNLADMVRETMESWHGRKSSPVYSLLPNLEEPNWKRLRIGDVGEFWHQHDAWSSRIDLAAREKRLGDVLVLADEAPVAALRAEAWFKAGKALRGVEGIDFALEQYDRCLAVEPLNLKALQERGVCLQRLGLLGRPEHSLDRAREHYRTVLKTYPDDPETWALLGRIDKDAWRATWQKGEDAQRRRQDAAYEDALLRAAIDSYTSAYRRNCGHYFSGINAVTLMSLYKHLTNNTRYDAQLAPMAGAVQFAAECEPDEKQRFWALATLGDLQVLTGPTDTVVDAYKVAIAKNDKDWFALNSVRAQLEMLQSLEFRTVEVQAGIATFDRALERLTKPEDKKPPRQVLLFSGHMIDAPGRAMSRFPAEKEAAAAKRIAEVLEGLGAGAEDIAFTQGACGGDLLFTEACQELKVDVRWLQPFREPQFIDSSVLRGGEAWRTRYLKARAKLSKPPRAAPEALGEPPGDVEEGDLYERGNVWLLYSAMAYGLEKVQFICLWNGEGGDGRGGTSHMYQEVKRRTGQVTWIKTQKL